MWITVGSNLTDKKVREIKKMEFVPALTLTTFFLVIYAFVVAKLSGTAITEILKSSNGVLIVAVLMFASVGIIYLFAKPDWAADLMKVVAGIVVGSVATKGVGGSINASGTFGDSAKVAGRDINDFIDHVASMSGEINQIKEAVFHQAEGSQSADLLFLPIFLDQGEPISMSASAIREVGQNGWALKTATQGYSGNDAFVLIFSRPSENGEGRVFQGIDQLEVESA